MIRTTYNKDKQKDNDGGIRNGNKYTHIVKVEWSRYIKFKTNKIRINDD